MQPLKKEVSFKHNHAHLNLVRHSEPSSPFSPITPRTVLSESKLKALDKRTEEEKKIDSMFDVSEATPLKEAESVSGSSAGKDRTIKAVECEHDSDSFKTDSALDSEGNLEVGGDVLNIEIPQVMREMRQTKTSALTKEEQ